MNKVKLQGIIKDILPSHTIQDVEYYKASLVILEDNRETIVPLKFKKLSNPYKEGDVVSLEGNIRTYSTMEKEKSRVQPYVFTYFDVPNEPEFNHIEVDGYLCKKGQLRKTHSGKDILVFVLVNYIKGEERSFRTYLPVVAWGKFAKEMDKRPIGEFIGIVGHFSSRTYKQPVDDSFEFRLTYEVNLDDFLETAA